MNITDISALIDTFDGSLTFAPESGSDVPEIAWGDYFFYYSPDGRVPQQGQPYATIVTKDYPDDAASRLDEPHRWRLNIHVGRSAFADQVGTPPDQTIGVVDYAAVDTLLPHPTYAAQSWISIVNPAAHTERLVTQLLADAHEAARRRADRRRH